MSSLLQSRSQHGLSLIELMISSALGMMIIVTIGYVYAGAARTFRSIETSSRMQESARYAVEQISHDMRMAGSMGCSATSYANVLNAPNAWQYNLSGFPLMGYEEGVSITSLGIANRLRGDAITLVRADNAQEMVVAAHEPFSATLTLTAKHDIQQGEILAVTDCAHAAVFQMTGTNNSNAIKTVNHNAGTSSPGNFRKELGLDGAIYSFSSGSRLYRLDASTYYIGYSGNGRESPGLYRKKLKHQSGKAFLEAEEVAEGVEDMRIRYGVDTSVSPDKQVDAYLTADRVAAVAPEATLENAWKRVLSVKISFLIASREGEYVTEKPQTYTFNGQTSTATDGRLRKVFTTTIAVRDRL